MFRLYLSILFIFSALGVIAQDYTLKGRIQEDVSHSPIHLANVFIKNTSIGTASDSTGLYQITIPQANINDTIVFSALGYQELEIPIQSIYPKKKYNVAMQDSMFLLDEVVAFCYDYIEGLYWTNKKEDKKDYLLTFVSKKMTHLSNFLLLMKERLGKPKKHNNAFVWKKVKVPGVKGKTKFTLRFFRCGYCPDDKNITVTIDAKNSSEEHILLNDSSKTLIAAYFQELLDKTFEQGVNISELEKRKRIYYLPEAEKGYTGKVYGYFKEGQKGLRGYFMEGKKDKRWEYWFKNGKKKMVAFFENGKKVGTHVSWFKDGSLRIKNTYENGRLVGNNFWWYENGNIKKIASYKEGVFYGKAEWEKNGQLKLKKGVFEEMSPEDIENIKSMKGQQGRISDFIMRFKPSPISSPK